MKRLSLVFQICFWFLIMALQMAMAGDFHSFAVVPLFAGLSLILCMFLFYMNTLWLFPRFFEKHRYGLYVLINLLAFVLLIQLFFTIERLIVINFRSEEDLDNLSSFYPYFRVVILLVFVYFISLAYSLIRKVQVQDTTVKQLLQEKEEKPQLKDDHLIIRADRKLHKINFDDLEEQLPSSLFLRIHKSYIVAINEMESLEGNSLEIGGAQLSVGKSFRPDVERVFGIRQ